MAKRRDSKQPGPKKAARGRRTPGGATRPGPRAATTVRRPGAGGGTRKKVARLTRTANKATTSAARKKSPAGRRNAAPKASRKSPARKTSVRKAPARKNAARKSAVRKAASRKAALRRATARKTVVRKASAQKAATKKATTRKSPAPRARAVGRRRPAVLLSSVRKVPALDRARRIARNDDLLPAPDAPPAVDRAPSSGAGHRELLERRYDHPETSPALTGGDVDADWEGAYATGDETPGGDNPTPDQGVVEQIGQALGVRYEDDEELRGADKIIERDKHRWDPDPESPNGDDD